ncbi:unnamed protein product, partial [Discosporangium mesarthrocarpum]
MQESLVDGDDRPYFPFNRREHYPINLKTNFRDLSLQSLLTYVTHHGLHVRPDASREELAIACARHFNDWNLHCDSVQALRSLMTGRGAAIFGDWTSSASRELVTPEARKRKRRASQEYAEPPSSPHPHHSGPRFSPHTRSLSRLRSSRTGLRSPKLARERERPWMLEAGDQVRQKTFPKCGSTSLCLAKADGDPFNGWILARVVQERGGPAGLVELHDEDDLDRVFTLPESEVRLLVDLSRILREGDTVLAVFPDTTSFYRATVHGGNDSNNNRGGGGGRLVSLEAGAPPTRMVNVMFEDDLDENGDKVPFRSIPVDHALLTD